MMQRPEVGSLWGNDHDEVVKIVEFVDFTEDGNGAKVKAKWVKANMRDVVGKCVVGVLYAVTWHPAKWSQTDLEV